jgi:hypothetical protein
MVIVDIRNIRIQLNFKNKKYLLCKVIFNRRHVHIYKYQKWASAILVRTSAIPQYCGQPNQLQNCRLKIVADCDCGP